MANKNHKTTRPPVVSKRSPSFLDDKKRVLLTAIVITVVGAIAAESLLAYMQRVNSEDNIGTGWAVGFATATVFGVPAFLCMHLGKLAPLFAIAVALLGWAAWIGTAAAWGSPTEAVGIASLALLPFAAGVVYGGMRSRRRELSV